VFLPYRQTLIQTPEINPLKNKKESAFGSISEQLGVTNDNQYVIHPTLGASEVSG